ncbi:MAG: arginine--tRNA ligase [Chloroflexota bacterium]
MITTDLGAMLRSAIERAQHSGDLPTVPIPDIALQHPQNPAHGDYAANLALRLARAAGMSPMAIAGAITRHVEMPSSVAAVEVAPPGFINITLSHEWLQQRVAEVLAAGDQYGSCDLGAGQRVQVEFVSGNPTGPLHVGAGRNAALGDSLANVLMAAGYVVEREYYLNDAGSQISALGASVFARYCEALGVEEPFPENGYQGDYVTTLGRSLVGARGRDFLSMSRDQAIAEITELAVADMCTLIAADLERMNVRFDRWFSERSLFSDGTYQQTMNLLRQKGYVTERDGAVWFASTELGEDKDNVLVRGNGQPTYFASDIAYHYDKFIRRGFDRVIDVWSADHQGHVPRMKAVMSALGIDPDRLTLAIYQLVNLVRDGKPVRMGKRSGEFVTLGEVLDDVGPDAVRFFLVARSADAMMDFDLELAKQQSNENPVYYVQYAHARVASMLHVADALTLAEPDLSLLTHESELALLRKMSQLPEIIELAATTLAPHHLPYYAQEVASAFHAFYRDCRVLSDDLALTSARVALVRACQVVLARSLAIIGVSTPETM